MGALSHYLESDGLATTHISLIRPHTETIQPPRALWVPFELGRPLGAPHDAAFQKKVLIAALQLLEVPQGPVIVDFPEDEPARADEEEEGMVCPIALPPPPTAGGLAGALRQEVARLAPWYDRAVEARKRTAFGATGLSIEGVCDYILGFLDGADPVSPYPELSQGDMLKLACDDLKAYYIDAVTAQPGFTTSDASERWFWHETAAGKVFAALRERCAGSTDKTLEAISGFFLVPRAQLDRESKNKKM